jgi:hypothetical protein
MAPPLEQLLRSVDECFEILVPNLDGPIAPVARRADGSGVVVVGGDGDDDGDDGGRVGDRGDRGLKLENAEIRETVTDDAVIEELEATFIDAEGTEVEVVVEDVEVSE